MAIMAQDLLGKNPIKVVRLGFLAQRNGNMHCGHDSLRITFKEETPIMTDESPAMTNSNPLKKSLENIKVCLVTTLKSSIFKTATKSHTANEPRRNFANLAYENRLILPAFEVNEKTLRNKKG